jgi:coniferyl-aldehyde dehydrogenase
MLERQRCAFLKDGPPALADCKARLKRLRAAVLAHRGEVAEAVSADFGYRSRRETDLMEIVGIIQATDYLLRNLKRFMRPECRHVGLFYRNGRAYVEYQLKGVGGVMAPWTIRSP